MTAKEAIEIASHTAQELNIPWSSVSAVAQRRRLWPFPAFWKVVSVVSPQSAETTIHVNEGTRLAVPRRVVYRKELSTLSKSKAS
jgi:hypothetical protein